MKEDIEYIYEKLSLRKAVSKQYNPMETFVECVSQKEICHTSILAELLNPKGEHGLRDSFLKIFLQKIGCDNFVKANSGIVVKREMAVNRILTEGGSRRIDICLIQGKNAIIIENKINNAREQYCQIADYKAGLEHLGFDVLKTVCLQGNVYNDIGADINISLIDLASLLERVLQQCDVLKSYIILLRNMGQNNILEEKTKELMKLPVETLTKARDISKLFYDDFVSDCCFNEIISKVKQKNGNVKDLCFARKRRYLQIWDEKGYKRGKNCGFWIEIWLRDYERFEIWIRRDTGNELTGVEDYVEDVHDYFRLKEGVVQFPFLGKEWKNELIEKIQELLDKLYSDIE